MDGTRRALVHETGEVFEWHEVGPDGRPILPRPRARPKDRASWAVVYLPALAELAADSTLTPGEARLLLHFMARAPLGECQQINRSALARDLDVHRHTIERALAGLMERRVLIQDPDDRGCFWLDPDLFWRGYRTDQDAQRKRLASA